MPHWGHPLCCCNALYPWQGRSTQEEEQNGCTRLAAHRSTDPGCPRQERDGRPGQCHPGCRLETLSYQVQGEPCTSPRLSSLPFFPPLLFKGLMLHFECIGLLRLTLKPHSPCTFFFLSILLLLCWSEETNPVLFSHLWAFKMTSVMIFSNLAV